MSFILKVVILIILLIIIINHWDVVVNFVDGIVDWIIYYMKIIATGPST